MIEIFDLVKELKTFHLFNQLKDELMNFSKNTRSKLLTQEILTKYANEIIASFIQSDLQDLDMFFRLYLESLYPDNFNRQKSFCYIFILSLLFYKQKFNFLNLYYDLLAEEHSKDLYFFFFSSKNIILNNQNIIGIQYADLDKIYINDNEWIFVLNQILGFELEEIKEFKDDMMDKIRLAKHDPREKLIKYQKNDKLSLFFFLSEVIKKFQLLNDKYQSEFREKVLEDKNGLRDTTLHINDYGKINQEEQIEKLKQEIKEVIVQKNQFKNSCIGLMAYMHELDPLFTDVKEVISQNQKQMYKIKNEHIQGQIYDEFSAKVQMSDLNFLETGTNIKDNTSKNLHKELLNFKLEQFKMLSQRKKEKLPYVRKIIRDLKSKIFSDLFTLFKDGESRDVENMKRELKNIFGKYENLQNSDFVILNTYFNNYDSQDPENSIDNILQKVTNKMMEIVDKVIEEDESEENDLQEEIENIKKPSFKESLIKPRISKLEELKEESSRYDSIHENIINENIIPEENSQEKQIQNINSLKESIKQSQKHILDSNQFNQVQGKKSNALFDSKISENENDYINRINQMVGQKQSQQNYDINEKEQKISIEPIIQQQQSIEKVEEQVPINQQPYRVQDIAKIYQNQEEKWQPQKMPKGLFAIPKKVEPLDTPQQQRDNSDLEMNPTLIDTQKISDMNEEGIISEQQKSKSLVRNSKGSLKKSQKQSKVSKNSLQRSQSRGSGSYLKNYEKKIELEKQSNSNSRKQSKNNSLQGSQKQIKNTSIPRTFTITRQSNPPKKQSKNSQRNSQEIINQISFNSQLQKNSSLKKNTKKSLGISIGKDSLQKQNEEKRLSLNDQSVLNKQQQDVDKSKDTIISKVTNNNLKNSELNAKKSILNDTQEKMSKLSPQFDQSIHQENKLSLNAEQSLEQLQQSNDPHQETGKKISNQDTFMGNRQSELLSQIDSINEHSQKLEEIDSLNRSLGKGKERNNTEINSLELSNQFNYNKSINSDSQQELIDQFRNTELLNKSQKSENNSMESVPQSEELNQQKKSNLNQSEINKGTYNQSLHNQFDLGESQVQQQAQTIINSLKSIGSFKKNSTNLENFEVFKKKLDQMNDDQNQDETLLITSIPPNEDGKNSQQYKPSLNKLISNTNIDSNLTIPNNDSLQKITNEPEKKESEINESKQNPKDSKIAKKSKILSRTVKNEKGKKLAEKTGIINQSKGKGLGEFFSGFFK